MSDNHPNPAASPAAPQRTPVPPAVRRHALSRLRSQCDELATSFPNLLHVYAEAPTESRILELDIPYVLCELNGELYLSSGGSVTADDNTQILSWFGGGGDGGTEYVHLLLAPRGVSRAGADPLRNVINGLDGATENLAAEVHQGLLGERWSDDPPNGRLGGWLTMVHRLAWQHRPGSPLRASRSSWTRGARLLFTGSGVVAVGGGFEFPHDVDVAARVLSVWQRTGELDKVRAVEERIGWPPRHFVSVLPIDVFSGIAASVDLLLEVLDRHATSAPGAPDAQQVNTSEPADQFVRSGEMWHLRFKERAASYPNRHGLRYLHSLLSAPGQDIHCVRLYSGEDLLEYAGKAGHLQIDGRTRSEVRAAADRLTPERRALAEDYLRKALGKSGKGRQFYDEVERVRSTVRQRIRAAIEAIRKDLPELADHLKLSVKTGAYCTYRPTAPAPTWHV